MRKFYYQTNMIRPIPTANVYVCEYNYFSRPLAVIIVYVYLYIIFK